MTLSSVDLEFFDIYNYIDRYSEVHRDKRRNSEDTLRTILIL